MLTYYIAEPFDNQLYTAGVLRKDNESIFAEEGFTALKFWYRKNGIVFVKIARFIYVVTMALKIKKKSRVIFHFPLQATIYQLLLSILAWRGVTTIAVIIDIDGVRDKDEILLQKEIRLLKKFRYLIAHNESMKNLLLHYLPKSTIVSINLFDYPFTGQTDKRSISNNICVAANFDKGKYVYKLNQLQNLHFNLYGGGYDTALMKDTNNITYKGIVSPGILPANLQGSFGLIWDGGSIEKCDDYLKYNNPHKLSLYLVAGLPVIVWKSSAVAGFIENEKLGIIIASLLEIPEKIKNISVSEYGSMVERVLKIGEKIKTGYFLKRAIMELNKIEVE